MSDPGAIHEPVMLRECIEMLDIKPSAAILDCTLGRGGHTKAILDAAPDVRVIAIDRDIEAIETCSETLKKYRDRITFIHGNFGDAAKHLENIGISAADGLIADFGNSSPQLNDPSRGFSYTHSGPLDMRMDRSQQKSAFDIVNTYDRDRLTRIFRDYGEERYASLISAAIVRQRSICPIETTDRLSDIIKGAMPAKALREAQHPAKRVFMAIRIEVNNELGEIEKLLSALPELLISGARAVFITFHSLEDRIVKTRLREFEDGCKCPKEFPCVCGFKQTMRVITRKPVTTSETEAQVNPRSRSAKLRAAQRVG